MKHLLVLALAACLLLGGCSTVMDGSYLSVEPHQIKGNQSTSDSIHVSNYEGLCDALEAMTEDGTTGSIFYISQYDQARVENDMRRAAVFVCRNHPIAAYAVEEITWELGTSTGQSAIAVTVSYLHDRREIQRIQSVQDAEAAEKVIAEALNDCENGVVLYLENYEDTDFAQIAETYAFREPKLVMETPQVTVNFYPDHGDARVVELKFTYETSRDALRTMQAEVKPIFESAALYVSGDAQEQEKFSQLYSFLMERYDYKMETSKTPAYSLLRHGVGDARAFAVVYAAMCREAGLECEVISGTRWGENWHWNLIRDNDAYYHIDLLRSNELSAFTPMLDSQMEGYVWDYSAYPATPESFPQEPTEPTDTAPTETAEPTEETQIPTEETAGTQPEK